MKVLVLIFASLVSVFAEPPATLPPTLRVQSVAQNVPTALDTHATSDASIKPNAQYGPARTDQIYDHVRGGYSGSGYSSHGGYFGASGYHGDDYNSVPANYNFQYHVYAPEYGNDFGHQEARQGDVAQGRYFVLLPDGRKQIVEYTADQNGYNPSISYEGTAFGGFAGGNNNGGYYPGAGAYSRSAHFHGSNENGNYYSSGRYSQNNGGYQY